MKLIDSFTYFNEIELLQVRLEYLYDIVDEFLIVESNRTHTGNAKPFHLRENKDKIQQWKDKIKYIPVDFSPYDDSFVYNIDDTNTNGSNWKLENAQRNVISQYFTKYESKYSDEDIIMISDLDEIPSLSQIKYMLDKGLHNVYRFPMWMCYYTPYNVNVGELDNTWFGTNATTHKNLLKYNAQFFRDSRAPWNNHEYVNETIPVPEKGWHWSYMGGSERIITKIQSTADASYTLKKFGITLEEGIEKVKKKQDLYNRPGMHFMYKPEIYDYDNSIKNLIEKYRTFLIW